MAMEEKNAYTTTLIHRLSGWFGFKVIWFPWGSFCVSKTNILRKKYIEFFSITHLLIWYILWKDFYDFSKRQWWKTCRCKFVKLHIKMQYLQTEFVYYWRGLNVWMFKIKPERVGGLTVSYGYQLKQIHWWRFHNLL